MSTIRFGIIGQFQSGKSLLINCLIKRPVATVGVGTPTTHTVVNYLYSQTEYIEIEYTDGRVENKQIVDLQSIDTAQFKQVNVFLSVDFLKDYTLTDLPGFGANEQDNEVALSVLNDLDYAIVVVTNEKVFGTGSPHYQDFCILNQYGIPYYFILNCRDTIIPNKWIPCSENNEETFIEDLSLLDFYKPLSVPFEDNEKLIVNFMWYWYGISQSNDPLFEKKEFKSAIKRYDLQTFSKEEILQASNFNMVLKIFDMDNKAYLELKKEFKEELSKLKEELCPVGTIQAFAFNKVPQGWMVCDGRILHSSEYSKLYDAIGDTFGHIGNDMFKIPDLRGRFIRGWSKNGNIDKFRTFGSYQEHAIQRHAHSAEFERNITGDDGVHKHSIKCVKTSYGYGGWTSSTYYMNEITGADYMSSGVHGEDATLGSGMHNHKLPKIIINDVKDISQVQVNSADETRPDNCSLLFCIKVI